MSRSIFSPSLTTHPKRKYIYRRVYCINVHLTRFIWCHVPTRLNDMFNGNGQVSTLGYRHFQLRLRLLHPKELIWVVPRAKR